MKLIDTHSHLYDEAFDADRDEALARAAAEGVGLPRPIKMLGFSARHPISPAFGLAAASLLLSCQAHEWPYQGSFSLKH